MAKSDPLAYSDKFLAFWAEYPATTRRVNKPGAFKSWKAQKCDAVLDEVLAGLRKWKVHEQWLLNGGQFVPLVTTFLNQRRWEDAPGQANNGWTPDKIDDVLREVGYLQQ